MLRRKTIPSVEWNVEIQLQTVTALREEGEDRKIPGACCLEHLARSQHQALSDELQRTTPNADSGFHVYLQAHVHMPTQGDMVESTINYSSIFYSYIKHLSNQAPISKSSELGTRREPKGR